MSQALVRESGTDALTVQRTGRSRGLWSDAWRRLRRNKAAVIGLVWIVLMGLVGVGNTLTDVAALTLMAEDKPSDAQAEIRLAAQQQHGPEPDQDREQQRVADRLVAEQDQHRARLDG